MAIHKRFVACEATLEDSENEDDNGIHINGYLSKRIKMEGEDCTHSVSGSNYLRRSSFLPSIVDNDEDEHHDQPSSRNVGNGCIMNEDENGIFMLHMDIREPLSTLRSLLEQRLNMKLTEYGFRLQDSQSLESHKNLVDQCVQGEGLVQVNVQLKISPTGEKNINIVDVLKPAEEYVEIGSANEDEGGDDTSYGSQSDGKVMRWVVDPNFKKDQIKLNIPEDPLEWGVAHVRHWLLWAVRQFNLTGIKLEDWKITGSELCNMSINVFHSKVPNDPKNIFWTHIELLRKCKIVAIKPKPTPIKEEVLEEEFDPLDCERDQEAGESDEECRTRMEDKVIKMGHQNSGQIQLWQFLLELLTDKNHRDAIQWLENEGEFKLINPELVAHLWGVRKNKPTMNYEKLSRALRYYYDGDMISKVHGKRFVYKFVCDLKMLLGYSANELNALVVEAELRAKQSKNQNPSLDNIFGSDYIECPIIP